MATTHRSALDVALEQRQRVLDQTRTVLSERDRTVQQITLLVTGAESRVKVVLQQMDAAQRPAPGAELPVRALRDLEYLLDWCEATVAVARMRLQAAQTEAETARGFVATAHQAVRALELVLEKRAAEVARKVHRTEVRDADETAARVYSRNATVR
jgi:hypothetical protein